MRQRHGEWSEPSLRNVGNALLFLDPIDLNRGEATPDYSQTHNSEPDAMTQDRGLLADALSILFLDQLSKQSKLQAVVSSCFTALCSFLRATIFFLSLYRSKPSLAGSVVSAVTSEI